MRPMVLDLDRTLSCGQVFRWRKLGDAWQGFISGKEVTLRQCGNEVEVQGDLSEMDLSRFLRTEDDLDEIYQDVMVSCGDERMASIFSDHCGLRLVRQDPWECSASYILATFVHIPRIEMMIDNLCRSYGYRLPSGRYTFPTAEQICSAPEQARACGLGFRCDRFLRFARRVSEGEVDFQAMREMPYERCVKELKAYEGIGDKVADCIALFSLDHLEAFPVDVRIMRAMEHMFSVKGSYRNVSKSGRDLFGQYAGYAQEYLYMTMARRSTLSRSAGRPLTPDKRS